MKNNEKQLTYIIVAIIQGYPFFKPTLVKLRVWLLIFRHAIYIIFLSPRHDWGHIFVEVKVLFLLWHTFNFLARFAVPQQIERCISWQLYQIFGATVVSAAKIDGRSLSGVVTFRNKPPNCAVRQYILGVSPSYITVLESRGTTFSILKYAVLSRGPVSRISRRHNGTSFHAEVLNDSTSLYATTCGFFLKTSYMVKRLGVR